MTYRIQALDSPGGQGVVAHEDNQWFLISIDHGWKPIQLTGVNDAIRWSRAIPALLQNESEFDNLEEAADSVRQRCLASLERPSTSLEEVIHLIPKEIFQRGLETKGRYLVQALMPELEEKQVELNKLVLQTYRQHLAAASKADVKLKLDLTDEAFQIRIDPDIFNSVFNMLVENAIKYSASGSILCLRTMRDTRKRRIQVNIILRVTDLAQDEAKWMTELKQGREEIPSGSGTEIWKKWTLVTSVMQYFRGSFKVEQELEGSTDLILQLPVLTH